MVRRQLHLWILDISLVNVAYTTLTPSSPLLSFLLFLSPLTLSHSLALFVVLVFFPLSPPLGSICGWPVGPLPTIQGTLHSSAAGIQPGSTVGQRERGSMYTMGVTVLLWCPVGQLPLMTGTRHSLMVGDARMLLVCVVMYCMQMLLVGVSSVTVP